MPAIDDFETTTDPGVPTPPQITEGLTAPPERVDVPAPMVPELVESAPVETPVEPPHEPKGKRKHKLEDLIERNQAITKHWRTTETERDAAKAELAAARAELETLKRQPASRPEPVRAESRETAELVEPKLEDFTSDPAKYPDPYLALARALARHDREAERREHAAESARTQGTQDFEAKKTAHNDRVDALIQKNLEAAAAFAARKAEHGPMPMTPVLGLAILEAGDKSAEFVYALVRQPDLLDELMLLTEGKAPTPALVALAQRRLSRALTASTGSVPARPEVPVFRPLNPERTGTHAAPPTGEEADSVDAHISARRRSRR